MTKRFALNLQEGLGNIDRLVSLGSPHNPPPPGVIDQTRGILSHVAATCPGNFHEQVRPDVGILDSLDMVRLRTAVCKACLDTRGPFFLRKSKIPLKNRNVISLSAYWAEAKLQHPIQACSCGLTAVAAAACGARF